MIVDKDGLLTENSVFVSDRATNAPMDIFHFNEGVLSEELCVALTKTNRLWERGTVGLVVGPLGGSCVWPRRTPHWAKDAIQSGPKKESQSHRTDWLSPKAEERISGGDSYADHKYEHPSYNTASQDHWKGQLHQSHPPSICNIRRTSPQRFLPAQTRVNNPGSFKQNHTTHLSFQTQWNQMPLKVSITLTVKRCLGAFPHSFCWWIEGSVTFRVFVVDMQMVKWSVITHAWTINITFEPSIPCNSVSIVSRFHFSSWSD